MPTQPASGEGSTFPAAAGYAGPTRVPGAQDIPQGRLYLRPPITSQSIIQSILPNHNDMKLEAITKKTGLIRK